jgi:uncharacterized membrane protein
MDDQVTQLARHLLESGLTCLSEREQRVIVHIAKRLQVARDVNSVLEEHQTFGERLADRVAQLGGSWAFITIFTGLLITWVVANTAVLGRFGRAFDPYPYIFLNLILSMVAAPQAPVILMSKNRQAARDRLAGSLSTTEIAAVKKILRSPDPRTIWKIADLTKEVLIASSEKQGDC